MALKSDRNRCLALGGRAAVKGGRCKESHFCLTLYPKLETFQKKSTCAFVTEPIIVYIQ